MNNIKQFQITILTFILLFFIAAILLRLVNIIALSTAELYGYSLILYGIATVYTTFGERNKILLFLGSVLFLVGIAISLPAHFDIIQLSKLYMPSAILIAGIGLLIVYLDDTAYKPILIASLILLSAGVVLIFISQTIYFSVFLRSVIDFVAVYWLVLLIVAGITIILKR